MRELKLITDIRYEELDPEVETHWGSGKNSTTPVSIPICCDSRKHECPYALNVEIDTPEVSFQQVVCCVSFRKLSSYNISTRRLETC